MHFVTGGAFNGKSNWVKAYIQIGEKKSLWFSAYHKDLLPEKLAIFDGDQMIFEGIELWVKEWLNTFDAYKVQEKWHSFLEKCMEWESEKQGRTIVLIGSDISKGIVPIKTEDRLWRDVSGRAYQFTASKCDRVDVIWYGINVRVK